MNYIKEFAKDILRTMSLVAIWTMLSSSLVVAGQSASDPFGNASLSTLYTDGATVPISVEGASSRWTEPDPIIISANSTEQSEFEEVAQQPVDYGPQQLSQTELQLLDENPQSYALLQDQGVCDASHIESARNQAFVDEIYEEYDNDEEVIRTVAENVDYAVLASAAYDDHKYAEELAARGWVANETFKEDNFIFGNMSATLFTNPETGEVVLSFAGTDDLGDVIDDIQVGTQGISPQIIQARNLALEIYDQYPNVVFVGHSLGGRLAINAAQSTGNDAVVINSSPNNLPDMAGNLRASYANGTQDKVPNIIALRAPGDPVSAASPIREDIEVENAGGWVSHSSETITDAMIETERAYNLRQEEQLAQDRDQLALQEQELLTRVAEYEESLLQGTHNGQPIDDNLRAHMCETIANAPSDLAAIREAQDNTWLVSEENTGEGNTDGGSANASDAAPEEPAVAPKQRKKLVRN